MSKMRILPVLDADYRVVGYLNLAECPVDFTAQVAGKSFSLPLYTNPEVPAGPPMPGDSTDLVWVTLRIDVVDFYGPGKYADAPPDGRVHHLVALHAPSELWQTRGWYKRSEEKDGN